MARTRTVLVTEEMAKEMAKNMGCSGIHKDEKGNWMPCSSMEKLQEISNRAEPKKRSKKKFLPGEVDRKALSFKQKMESTSIKKDNPYTKPDLRERLKREVMAGSQGGRPGQWSARKAQILAARYKKAGGGYKRGLRKNQRSLKKWTREKWTTRDGKPAIRGKRTARYLPLKAWRKLTPAQAAATDKKKIEASKRGQQFVSNTRAAKKAGASVRKPKRVKFKSAGMSEIDMSELNKKPKRTMVGRKKRRAGKDWENLGEKPVMGIETLPGGGLVSGDSAFSGKAALLGPTYVRDNDPDVFIDAESARFRARQLGCIGISRRISKTGRTVWMPCTNMTDYANRAGSTPLGRRNQERRFREAVREILSDEIRKNRRK